MIILYKEWQTGKHKILYKKLNKGYYIVGFSTSKPTYKNFNLHYCKIK